MPFFPEEMHICKIEGANFFTIAFCTFMKTRIYYGQNFLTLSLEFILQKIKETVCGLRVNQNRYLQINFFNHLLIVKNFFWWGGGAFWATFKNFSWTLWATLESEIGAFVARNIGNTAWRCPTSTFFHS